MKKILDYLQELGFSTIEAKLYVTLLEFGPLTVQDLARRTKINRTAAYSPIHSLLNKGIFVEIRKGSRKQLTAIEPDRLHYLVENKLESVKTLERKFPDIVNTINTSLRNERNESKVEVTYYKGIIGVKKIYDEALKAHEVRSYVKVDDDPKLSSDNPGLFSTAFKKNKKLKVWEIIYDSPFSRRQAMRILSKNNNYFYKVMPPDLKWGITSEDIVIYDGKVAIINYKGVISSVVLQSADYYHNSKELFDFIWRMLPNPQIDS